MKRYYDVVNIVFLHSERIYGSTESIGLYASKIKYIKDGVEVEEMINNEDFTVMDEIVFEHVEEDK